MKTKTVTDLFKKIMLVSLAFLSFNTFAQEEESESTVEKVLSKISLSGSIDGYYRYNFGAPNDNSVAPASSFANQSGFALGMANVILGRLT